MACDFFISHVEEDSATARALAAALRSQHRLTWTYEENGVAGVSYLTQIFEAIEHCRAFVLLASPTAVKAHQVTREIEQAHEREKVIIAVRMGITHQQFVSSNPILRMACGTAVTLSAEEGDLTEIATRIIASLRYAESEAEGTRTREALTTPPLPDVSAPGDSQDSHPPGGQGTTAKKPPWTTTPVILTAVAAVIVVVAGLYLLLHSQSAPQSAPSPRPDRPTLATNELDEEGLKQIIETFGPDLYFASDERYFMDDPEYVLDHGTTLEWGSVKTGPDPGALQTAATGSKPTSSHTLLNDVRDVETSVKASNDREYWLRVADWMKPGDLARARALVRLLPVSDTEIEVQFWFFYPFNGPRQVRLCGSRYQCSPSTLQQCGRHYADWEHVSLLVSADTKQLKAVYLQRPDRVERFTTSDAQSELKLDGTRPVIYSAAFSHLHYASPGTRYHDREFSQKWSYGPGYGTASVDAVDRTEKGKVFRTGLPARYRIVSSELPHVPVTEPDWLDFNGRWGQYERLVDTVAWSYRGGVFRKNFRHTPKEVGMGPKGPKATSSWSGDFRRPATP